MTSTNTSNSMTKDSTTITTTFSSSSSPITTASSTAHRHHLQRPPSIITNKFIFSNKNRAINNPISAPLHPIAGLTTGHRPPSPLRVQTTIDPNYPTNILVFSPNGKERNYGGIVSATGHRNYSVIGNKHILRRKKSNLVRSAASYPNLNENHMEK